MLSGIELCIEAELEINAVNIKDFLKDEEIEFESILTDVMIEGYLSN